MFLVVIFDCYVQYVQENQLVNWKRNTSLFIRFKSVLRILLTFRIFPRLYFHNTRLCKDGNKCWKNIMRTAQTERHFSWLNLSFVTHKWGVLSRKTVNSISSTSTVLTGTELKAKDIGLLNLFCLFSESLFTHAVIVFFYMSGWLRTQSSTICLWNHSSTVFADVWWICSIFHKNIHFHFIFFDFWIFIRTVSASYFMNYQPI